MADIIKTTFQIKRGTAARWEEYVYGLHYSDPEDDKVYLCARTGEAPGDTVVLQYLPHELIGHYFVET